MDEPPRQRWGCLQWGVFIFCLLLLVFIVLPGPRIAPQGNQLRAVSNCRQIIITLQMYAKDHEGEYPDGQKREFHSANELFRELFKDRIVMDERIFGCPTSAFYPDNELGPSSDFPKALMPGECHWMLLKHQSLSSHPKTPIVIENSLTTSWPPKWSLETHAIRGRSSPKRKIVIGRNDGSVAVEELNADGTMDWHSSSNGPDGKSWIDTLTPEQLAKLSYWDIEEK